jgi:hypothetical protein
MAKTTKKGGKAKVKSLPARNVTSKQARGVKGGLLPAVKVAGQNKLADGSVRPINNVSLNFNKV